MPYLIFKDKPYFTAKNKVYPCSVSADVVTVDFKNPIKLTKDFSFDCFYTENEIKKKLGVFIVDTWDVQNNKVVKVSNKTVSSIPIRE